MTDTAQVIDSQNFDVEYSGPALDAHEMDVRDLAPALLNAANLFQNVNRLVYPTDRDVQVNIRATRDGSFVIQLRLLYDHAADVLGNRGVQLLGGVPALIAFVVWSIRVKIKRGQSGAPNQVDDIQPGLVRLTWPDGTVMEFPADVWRLLDDPLIANPLAEMVRPVSNTGVESLRIGRDGTTEAEVTTEDLPSFQPVGDPDREILSDSTTEVYLTIRNASFDPGLKWRFFDGRGNFTAPITDPDFNARIDNREAFAKGDQFRAMLRTRQWRDSTGIHSESEVVRVLEHSPPQEPDIGLFTEDSA